MVCRKEGKRVGEERDGNEGVVQLKELADVRLPLC